MVELEPAGGSLDTHLFTSSKFGESYVINPIPSGSTSYLSLFRDSRYTIYSIVKYKDVWYVVIKNLPSHDHNQLLSILIMYFYYVHLPLRST